jgi:acyl carrier protein
MVKHRTKPIKFRRTLVDFDAIEAVLRQHASIRDSVVIAHDHARSYRCLVAYVVSMHAPPPAVRELREFLRAHLPDYIIPSRFVFLETLPIRLNGKLDHKALEAHGSGRSRTKDNFAAPRTPSEKIMAKIWAKVLNKKQIGINDNFFDLGKYSISALQLITQVRKTFAVDLSVRALFEVPTVAGMTAAVVRKQYGWQIENGNGKLSSQLALQPIEKPQKPLYRS